MVNNIIWIIWDSPHAIFCEAAHIEYKNYSLKNGILCQIMYLGVLAQGIASEVGLGLVGKGLDKKLLFNIGAAFRHLEPVRQLIFNRSALFVRKRFRDQRVEFYDKFWHDVCVVGGWDYDDLGSGCYRIRSRDRVTYVIGPYVQLDSPAVLNIAGNKVLSRRLLEEIEVPVPRQLSFDLSEISQAQSFLIEVGGRVVVKPSEGGGGAGVTTDISDKYNLGKAALKASTVYSRVIVEEQIPGADYRLLYLDGALVDAIRRDRPSVIGDGKNTVSKLIKLENECRLKPGNYTALSPLVDDPSVRNYLTRKGLSIRHVPAPNEVFQVKTAINQNGARDSHRVTDIVHPYYRELGRRIANQVDIKLMGIDVITQSIEEPLDRCGGVVNEINGTPGFHHHELVSGESGISSIGPLVLEYILDNCRERSAFESTPQKMAGK